MSGLEWECEQDGEGTYRFVTFMLFDGGAGVDSVLFVAAGTGVWLDVASIVRRAQKRLIRSVLIFSSGDFGGVDFHLELIVLLRVKMGR